MELLSAHQVVSNRSILLSEFGPISLPNVTTAAASTTDNLLLHDSPQARFDQQLASPPEQQPNHRMPSDVAHDIGAYSFDANPAPQRNWTPLVAIEQHASNSRILAHKQPLPLSVSDMLHRLLMHSRRQQVLAIEPLIAEKDVDAEFARFDPLAFVRSQFDTQNLQQRRETNQVAMGISKETLSGGSLELSQAVGVQDNVVGIGLPDQGVSSLSIIYRQEVLRNGGRTFSLSRGFIAQTRLEQQQAKSTAGMAELVSEALQTYWRLHEARLNYYIQVSLSNYAQQLFQMIDERCRLLEDLVNSREQARALYFETQAELVARQAEILQLQDSLYRIVNDPQLSQTLLKSSPSRCLQSNFLYTIRQLRDPSLFRAGPKFKRGLPT